MKAMELDACAMMCMPSKCTWMESRKLESCPEDYEYLLMGAAGIGSLLVRRTGLMKLVGFGHIWISISLCAARLE